MSDSEEEDYATTKKTRGKRVVVVESESEVSSAEESGDESESEADRWLENGFDRVQWNNARAVLDAAELTARNLTVEVGDNGDGDFIADAMKNLNSQLSVLREEATSIKWNKAFPLRYAHSVRISMVTSESDKEIVRNTFGRCQVCGTREHNCRYIVELCGNCDEDGSFDAYDSAVWGSTPTEKLADVYSEFLENYEAVFKPSWFSNVQRQDELPHQVLGKYSVGRDCLRTLLLNLYAGNMFLYLTMQADEMLSVMGENDPGYATAPTVTTSRIKKFLNDMDCLHLALADKRRAIPTPLICPKYWNCIDNAIQHVSADDRHTALAQGGQRADEIMSFRLDCEYGHTDASEGEDEDHAECVGGDERRHRWHLRGRSGDDAEKHPPSKGIRSGDGSGTKRRLQKSSGENTDGVVNSDFSEEDERREHSKRAGNAKKRRSGSRGANVCFEGPSTRTRSKSAKSEPALKRSDRLRKAERKEKEEEEESEEEEDMSLGKRRLREDDEEEAEEEDASTAFGAASSSNAPREASVSAASRAKGMRIPGQTLASRRRIACDLLSLAARLSSEQRDADAALATSASLVVQELISALEEARSTAGI